MTGIRQTAHEWYEYEGSPMHVFAQTGVIQPGIADELNGAIITAYYDQTDLTPLRDLGKYLESQGVAFR